MKFTCTPIGRRAPGNEHSVPCGSSGTAFGTYPGDIIRIGPGTQRQPAVSVKCVTGPSDTDGQRHGTKKGRLNHGRRAITKPLIMMASNANSPSPKHMSSKAGWCAEPAPARRHVGTALLPVDLAAAGETAKWDTYSSRGEMSYLSPINRDAPPAL